MTTLLMFERKQTYIDATSLECIYHIYPMLASPSSASSRSHTTSRSRVSGLDPFDWVSIFHHLSCLSGKGLLWDRSFAQAAGPSRCRGAEGAGIQVFPTQSPHSDASERRPKREGSS